MKNRVRNILALFVLVIIPFSVRGAADVKTGQQSVIEKEVWKSIMRLPRYEVFDIISFKVEGSTVTLYGKVRNSINRPDAANSVKRIAGVEKVVNNIELLPVSRFDDDLRRRLFRQIVRTGNLYRYFLGVNPSVRLIVEHGNITLEGNVATRGDYDLMYIAARGVTGSFSVTNNLTIENELP